MICFFIVQLMPSPKWKLVVDIGDVEETLPSVANSASVSMELPQESESRSNDDLNIFAQFSTTPVASASVTQTVDYKEPRPAGTRDLRIDEVVSLLGEFTPSDPNSPLAAYLSGFMSLRLLLLRSTRSPEEEEFVKTMLDSFSSYTAGGRSRSDIAIMLARDCMFLLNQQQQAQQFHQQGQPFLGLSHSVMTGPSAQVHSNTGLSLFGLPSTSSSLQNSPALTPIPIPGSIDAMSIVSNYG